jgi:cyclohexadienyl dehydratase
MRGRCDIAMGGITVTAARQQIAEFTVPYLDSGKVPLVAQAGADAFGSIDQINTAGVRVIENSGGTTEQFARQHVPNAFTEEHKAYMLPKEVRSPTTWMRG